MPRKQRIHYEGALYHVMARGNHGCIETRGDYRRRVSEKAKKQKIADIRKAIVKLSETRCEITNKELGEKLNVDSTLISKIKSDETRMTVEARDIIDRYNLSICQA